MGSAILPNTSGDPSLPNQVELTQANAAASITQYYKAASNQLGTFGDYISGHWEWQAPNQPAGMYHWWMGVNYSSKPDLWMMRPNPGLPGTITDPLFTPVDASKAPSQQTAIGAVMPYFALTYLPFKSVDILSNPDTQERGCYG